MRDAVEVNGIVPALPPSQAAARAVASGCATVKIKVAAVGQSLDDDVARVAAVREALPSARIRVDANGGWRLSEAVDALRELAPFGLEYAEQPCATVEDLAALRARDLGVLIAADESIRRAADPLRVKAAGAADIAVLKVQPLGGPRACLRLAEELGPARGGVERGGDVGRAARGRGAGRGAARAALRVRAGDRAAAGRRRGARSAGAARGDRRGARASRWTPTCCSRRPPVRS